MKYLYITIILSLLCIDLSAQARMINNRLSVGSLTAASEKLEVFGDAQITGTNPFMRFKLTDAVPSAGDESGLHWKNSVDNTNMRMLYSWLDNRLYVLPDTDQNFAHLSIENNTGHVGVNVRDPLEQFHVAGKMFITDDIRFDGAEYLQWEEFGTRKAYLRYNGTDILLVNDEIDGWITLSATSEVQLATNDVKHVWLKADGKLGVGDPTPSEKLDVDGNITVPANFRYGFDEAGVNKAGMAYNGTNMFVVNSETGGALTLDAKSHLSLGVNSSETVRVALNGNVGIGQTAPAERLHINGGIRIGSSTGNGAGTIRYTGGDFEGRVGASWVSLTAGGGGGSLWTSSGSNAYFNTGNVGIGTTNPAHTLQVNGDIGMTGEIIGVSDIRTKKDISSIENASAIINKLRPVHYEFANEDFESLDLPQGKQYGFIAQEVETVLPELVSVSAEAEVNGEETSLKGINYTQIIPVLTQAIQEQQVVVQRQQVEIDELKQLVRQLIEGK